MYERLILCVVLVCSIVYIIQCMMNIEGYQQLNKTDNDMYTNYNYNYALQSGKPIAGTVYANCVNCTPGLGWVL